MVLTPRTLGTLRTPGTEFSEKILMQDVLVNIGFGNVVFLSRVVSVVAPASAPIKRLREDARQGGRLIDATSGRKTRAVIVTDSNHIVLSSLQTETLVQRINNALADKVKGAKYEDKA